MKTVIKRKSEAKFLIILCAVVLAILTLFVVLRTQVDAASTFPNQYELVTRNNVNGETVNRDTTPSGISSDGSKVLFVSSATNLPMSSSVIGTYVSSLYMRDMTTTASTSTTRVDLSVNGSIPDKAINGAKMNTTGRYIGFSTTASNVIDGTTLNNSMQRAYFKDLQTNTVEILTNVSDKKISTPGGLYSAGFGVESISDDGRYVLVSTTHINSLIPGTRTDSVSGNITYQSGLYLDLALLDRTTGSWTLVNTTTDGIMQNKTVDGIASSCDASIIVFGSAATNVTSGFSGSGSHIYLADIRNGLKITDITAGATADSALPNISCNGRYVTYSTKDRTVITPTPAGMSAYMHLVRYDRFTGERKYIDSASNNTTFDIYQTPNYIPSSVSDAGDVVLVYGTNVTDPSYRTIKFKHLSDLSGTLEAVQHNYAGLIYQSSAGKNNFLVSSNGQYIVASSADAYTLGVTTTSSSVYNILRIKTGL